MRKSQSASSGVVIFRRYRRGRDGQILDAWKYGKKAWPIHLRGTGRKK